MTHLLKAWPESFEAVWRGDKRHEVRVNDRGFSVNDVLVLNEWNPETQECSGRRIFAFVTYISRGGEWGLPEHLCVMTVQVTSLYERQRESAGGGA